MAVLKSFGQDVPDWMELFHSGTVDLMKLMGDGKYPGVLQDPGHTVVNVPVTEQCLAATAGDVAEAQSIDGLDMDTQHETLDTDETDGLVFATDTLTAGDHPIDVPAITLRDLIPEPNKQEDEQRDWLLFKGKKVHKASVIWYLFSSNKAKKSRECLLRVRGYTHDFSPKSSLNCDDLTGDHFLVGDLAAILICCDQVVSLAIMQVASIEQDSQRVTAIKEESLHLSTTSTFVSGQILKMCPAATHNDTGDPLPDDVQQYLLWTGSYCRFSPWRGDRAVFWKYNVHQHITSSHDTSYESLPAGFAKSIEISQLEKEHLGIPPDLIDNSVQDDSNATAVASTSQNSLTKCRQQTLQGNTGSKCSKKV
jgi:hypothetical protein